MSESTAKLLDELEIEARQRAITLEATNRLSAGFTDTHYALTVRERRELKRLKNCAALATDADTYVALCKGLPVHASRLAPEIVRLWRKP